MGTWVKQNHTILSPCLTQSSLAYLDGYASILLWVRVTWITASPLQLFFPLRPLGWSYRDRQESVYRGSKRLHARKQSIFSFLLSTALVILPYKAKDVICLVQIKDFINHGTANTTNINVFMSDVPAHTVCWITGENP